jgi:hypothetical protein
MISSLVQHRLDRSGGHRDIVYISALGGCQPDALMEKKDMSSDANIADILALTIDGSNLLWQGQSIR